MFYLPVALVAFTRFGYLMRRTFFRLMLGDLNNILEGLTELEDKSVITIDCRRAQFSEKEPIVRLRMICQSWKVMFQAEYSSGSPLRMLVDLRASVDQALGRGKASEPAVHGKAKAKSGLAASPAVRPAGISRTGPDIAKPVASAAAAGASKPSGKSAVAPPKAESTLASSSAAEFEVSGTPGWDSDAESQPGKKS